MVQKGHLFVIDGTDGSGKQTVSKAVYEKLKQKGFNVKLLEYPNYKSNTSALVKMYLEGEFGKKPEDINPYTASTFYAVDRVGSYLKEWKEDYENGVIFIADRYTSSNAIHQASKIEELNERKSYLQWLLDLEFHKMNLPYPTETIFLNMPVENSLRLMKERANKITGKNQKDIHEGNINFMKKSYQNACWVADYLQWKTVHCVTKAQVLRPIEDIVQDVYTLITQKLE